MKPEHELLWESLMALRAAPVWDDANLDAQWKIMVEGPWDTPTKRWVNAGCPFAGDEPTDLVNDN